MTTQSAIKECEHLMSERGWNWEDNRSTYLLELLMSSDDAKRHVANTAQQINHQLASAAKAMDQDLIMNDLGELQSLPSYYEAAIGQYTMVRNLIRKFLEIFPPIEKD